MRTGWIKLHRKLLDNPVASKDADHLAVWVWLLCEAAYEPHPRLFGKTKVTVQPGQLITSCAYIASELKVSESKVKRILKLFENDRQIEQQTTRYGRVISILQWSEYQEDEQQSERRVTDEWTTSDRRVDETKEDKEDKEGKNNRYSEEVREIIYCLNETTGQHYRSTTPKTVKLITGKLKDNFTVDDFKTVIWKKAKQWMGDPKMQKFLRPETLFGNKFEGYLNEAIPVEDDFTARLQQWAMEDGYD